jgi:hypothetical protein
MTIEAQSNIHIPSKYVETPSRPSLKLYSALFYVTEKNISLRSDRFSDIAQREAPATVPRRN